MWLEEICLFLIVCNHHFLCWCWLWKRILDYCQSYYVQNSAAERIELDIVKLNLGKSLRKHEVLLYKIESFGNALLRSALRTLSSVAPLRTPFCHSKGTSVSIHNWWCEVKNIVWTECRSSNLWKNDIPFEDRKET